MLRIDPGTGAVARGFSGRGSAARAAAVLVGTLGFAWLGTLESADCLREGAAELADLHEVELTDDLLVDVTPAGGAAPDDLLDGADRILGHAPMEPADPAGPDGAAYADDPDVASLDPEPDDENVAMGDPLPSGARDFARGLTERRAERRRGVAWGVAGCLRRDYPAARAAYERLRGSDREQLVAICLQHGSLLP